MKKPLEYIICSAIQITNVNDTYNAVYLGLRHVHCFQAISRVRALVQGGDEDRVLCLQNSEQGFLTSTNRFVDREEAMNIALANDQVLRTYGKGDKLYSECLY